MSKQSWLEKENRINLDKQKISLVLASKLLTAAVGGSVGGFSQSSHHVVLSSDLNCPPDAFVEPFSVTT